MTADLELIFLRVARPDVALIKFLFESYEGVAVVRTDHGKTANDAAVFGDSELSCGDVGKFRLLLACLSRR